MKELPFEDAETMETAHQERLTMIRISTHKHICRYIDSFIATKNGYKLYLVMQYCDKGDLAQYLDRMKSMQSQVVSSKEAGDSVDV